MGADQTPVKITHFDLATDTCLSPYTTKQIYVIVF